VVVLLVRGKTNGIVEERHDLKRDLDRRCTHVEVNTINTTPLIVRGDMGVHARTVNGALARVKDAHIHSVGGGEVHAPVTWLILR
jgi:hypothetical protein